MNEIVQRKLIIKTYHVDAVEASDDFSFSSGKLYVKLSFLDSALADNPYIKSVNAFIIKPGDTDRWTNSIMDIIPVSAKVLGSLGEGISHTFTGFYVMLSGVDENDVQVAEFGSSEGRLKEQLCFNRAGTPSDGDYIIALDMKFAAGQGTNREAVLESHRLCDLFIQEMRKLLKKADTRAYSEKHEFCDTIRPGKLKVAVVKQIAGQGAMYDNCILPNEPAGVAGGRSIIDMGNIPIVLSPNEYRDGAIRAMT